MAVRTDTRGVILQCRSCGQKNRVAFAHVSGGTRCGKCKTPIAPPDTPIEISSADAFDDLIASSPLPVVVDFWAPWCGPCRMVAPELEKVAAKHAGRIVLAKVNTEELPELSDRFGIRSIPTLSVFRSGRQVASDAGARPAPDIERFVFGALGP
jgi:thioredoxin 2